MFTHLIFITLIHVKLSNGSILETKFVGSVYFNHDFYLNDVLYILSFYTNLIFVPKMIQFLLCNIIFNFHQCIIQGIHTLKRIGAADLLYGLYLLTHPILPNTFSNFTLKHSIYSFTNYNLWHQCLGHPSHDNIIHINKVFSLPNMFKSPSPCDTCFAAKHKRLPFPVSIFHFAQCFNLIHMDIWDPIYVSSMFGRRYFLTVINDHGCFCWIFLMRHKSETSTLVKAFVNYAKTQFHCNVKALRSDNGPGLTLQKIYLTQDIIVYWEIW